MPLFSVGLLSHFPMFDRPTRPSKARAEFKWL
jgi:hypothetical protein